MDQEWQWSSLKSSILIVPALLQMTLLTLSASAGRS